MRYYYMISDGSIVVVICGMHVGRRRGWKEEGSPQEQQKRVAVVKMLKTRCFMVLPLAFAFFHA